MRMWGRCVSHATIMCLASRAADRSDCLAGIRGCHLYDKFTRLSAAWGGSESISVRDKTTAYRAGVRVEHLQLSDETLGHGWSPSAGVAGR